MVGYIVDKRTTRKGVSYQVFLSYCMYVAASIHDLVYGARQLLWAKEMIYHLLTRKVKLK